MVAKVHQDFGMLDILLNNVGIQYVAPVHEFPDDKWDAMIAITLSSAFHTTKAALPRMIEQEWGRIINTGSMHALVASPYKSAYNAAKHGIAGKHLQVIYPSACSCLDVKLKSLCGLPVTSLMTLADTDCCSACCTADQHDCMQVSQRQ